MTTITERARRLSDFRSKPFLLILTAMILTMSLINLLYFRHITGSMNTRHAAATGTVIPGPMPAPVRRKSCSIPVLPVSTDPVKITAQASQTKLIEGEDGTFYVKVLIETPDQPSSTVRRPVDMLVVLDRSGSMNEPGKLPLAKYAIKDLLRRLSPEDRFSLVVFDTFAYTSIPLTAATPQNISSISERVSSIDTGDSTNIGDGLKKASEILSSLESGRARRVIVLSDGAANKGITNPESLGRMAGELTEKEAVVSTVGMGLSFNEGLMTTLADRGMGKFFFLESLDNLPETFAKDLVDGRSLYSNASWLTVSLPPGFNLVDASGYPLVLNSSNNGWKIPVGQLLAGSKKQLFLTIKAPTNKEKISVIEGFHLSWQKDGQEVRAKETSDSISVETVAAVRREEAIASVNAPIYDEAWRRNNYAVMLRDVGTAVKSGDQSRANRIVDDYKVRAQSASEFSGTISYDDARISGVLATIVDAFSGPDIEQAKKQSRTSKGFTSDAWKESR